MKSIIIASRYSKGLFKACSSLRMQQKVLSELKSFKTSINSIKGCVAYLENPIVKVENKFKIVEELSKALRTSEVTFRFIKLLIQKQRLPHLESIIAIFEEELKKSQNIKTIKIESAVALDSLTIQKIKNILSKKLNSKIEMEKSVNPDLIAGLKLSYDDVVIDGSLATMLNNLKQSVSNKQ